ncbi:response regulator [Christiangramia marina]|uniref:response regulator n=1 Tax=Christiangramia marina TaxID=409436 RepID=UPI003AA9B07B
MRDTQILVIDDEKQIRKLLEINLKSNQYNVLMAEDGKSGQSMAASHQPDLIILDLGLPDLSGHEVLLNLREWYKNPIIILSVLDNEKDIVKALDNGATDYLTKPFRTGELLARLRASLRNVSEDPGNSLFEFDDFKLDRNKRILLYKNEKVNLTSTEYKLLTLFASNSGKVLTHQHILKEVWGHAYIEETQYLRVFVGSLRKKIEPDPNHPTFITTESGVGYRFL